VIIYEPTDDDNPLPPDPDPEPEDDEYIDDGEDKEPRIKTYASSVSARIISERLLVREEGGVFITESYLDYSKRTITEDYSSLNDFLKSWNSTKKKKAIIDELEKKGILIEQLAHEVGKEFGYFDLICHIAYDQPPLTRKERAQNVKKRNYFAKYDEQMRDVLKALLDKYQDEGVTAIETGKVLRLKPFDKIGTPMEIVNDVFGGKQQYDNAINELEQHLYQQEQA
jgi:type I restriction enzyme R subunit